MQFKGLVTRSSNGSIELAGVNGAAVPNGIQQGSEVDVTLDVTRTAEQIEADTDRAKEERGAPRRVVEREIPESSVANLPGDVKTIGQGATPGSVRTTQRTGAATPAQPAETAAAPAQPTTGKSTARPAK